MDQSTKVDQSSVLSRADKRELLMSEEGRVRFRSRFVRDWQEGRGNTTYPGVLLTKGLIEPHSKAIEEWVSAALSGAPRRRAVAAKLLQGIQPTVASYLTLQVVMSTLSTQPSWKKASIKIGALIEDELRFRSFEKSHKALFLKLQESTKTQPYDRRRTVLVHSEGKAGILWQRWPEADRLRVGQQLLELLMTSTGIIGTKLVSKRKHHREIVMVSDASTQEWIDKAVSRGETIFPVYLPTLQPPKPWTSPMHGGYFNRQILRPKFVKTDNMGYLSDLSSVDMPDVYEAVNRIQETAWRVNNRVYEVMTQCWTVGLGVGDFPDSGDVVLPPKPHDIATNEEARKQYRREAAKAYSEHARKFSKQLQSRRCLEMARMYRSEKAFWIPHCLDFRGRVYPIPSLLTPQGPDYARALLEFADDRPPGERGLYWLAVHGCNSWGNDKIPLDQRADWVLENEAMIVACAEHPFDHREWMDADSPWQFLAFCYAWKDQVDGGYDAPCSLPISVDGTCNGLQHFSAILRDEVGARAVNVLPGEKPADIYQEVADVVNRLVDAAAEQGDETALKWQGLVDRKITKRPTMTLVYGASLYGMRDQVVNVVRDWKASGVELPFDEDGWDEADWLARRIWDALDEVVLSAKEAMDWLQQAARVAASEGLPLHWETPVGFPVLQAYRDVHLRKVKTKLAGSLVYHALAEDTDELDSRRQASGIAPNWIHSLDAAHLMMTVVEAKDIKSWSMVHDSYGCHPADMDVLADTLRETFIEIHREDQLREFARQLKDLMLPENWEKLPPLPERGSLDLETVRESRYFFA